MRRSLLVAAVVVPAVALAAVSAGIRQVVEVNNFNSDVSSSYVNLDQCQGRDTLHLEWNIGGTPTFLTDDNYLVFASNTAPSVPTGETLEFCPTADSTGGTGGDVFAAQVGSVSPATRAVETLEVPGTRAVVDGANLTCDEASEAKVVHICAHWTAAGGAKKGSALGTFIIQVKRPNAPASVTTTPGEGALNISWPAATTDGGAVAARSYRVIVLNGAVEVHREEVNATSLRVDGLQNGVQYSVQVFGLSVAKNPSAAPALGTGTPTQVEDFWENYRSSGGREQGGCGAGGAGPLALLSVAGLLAALRRRK